MKTEGELLGRRAGLVANRELPLNPEKTYFEDAPDSVHWDEIHSWIITIVPAEIPRSL